MPDSYLKEGDNDALGWVDRAFKKAPEPEPPAPPEPTTQRFQTNTNEYKLLFNDSGGNRYRGAVDIIYQFNSGKWEFRAVKAGSNDILFFLFLTILNMFFSFYML